MCVVVERCYHSLHPNKRNPHTTHLLFLSSSFLLRLLFRSLLAPFASLCLVFNLIGAHLLLGEKVGWLEILSTLMIVSGCAVTTIFGAKNDASFSLIQCPNEEIIMTNATYRSEPCLCGPDITSEDKCPENICNCVNLSQVLERPSAYVKLIRQIDVLFLKGRRRVPLGVGLSAICCDVFALYYS